MTKLEFEKIIRKGIEDDTVNIILTEGQGTEFDYWVDVYVVVDGEYITIELDGVQEEFETLEQAKKVQNKLVSKIKKWITGRDYLKLNISQSTV